MLRSQTLEHGSPSLPIPIVAAHVQSPSIARCEPPAIPETTLYKPIQAAFNPDLPAGALIEDAAPSVIHERPSLPISPLMDPNYIAAKEKHIVKKPRAGKNPEPFQQMLAKNPYARALAYPLRKCLLTYNVLPSFFLQDFSLMAHPETGGPWYVPRSLANRKKAQQSSEEKIDLELEGEQGPELEEGIQRGNTTQQIRNESSPLLGFSVYTLASKLAIGAIQDHEGYGRKQAPKRKAKMRRLELSDHAAPHRLIPEGYRQDKRASSMVSPAQWREDMHTFVLTLMRRRLCENLVAATKLKRGYVVGCTGWEDALAKPQVGAFLWTGGIGGVEMDPPPEFATLDVTTGRKSEGRTKKVPVHNLRRLLGKEKLAELREKLPSGIFEREVVVLKHKQQVIEMEMQLWKLEGFLAEYRDLYRDLEEGTQKEVKEEYVDGDDMEKEMDE